MVKVYVYRRLRERNRWLRSDGKPNFKSKIHERPSEIAPVVIREAPTCNTRTPVLKVCELMSDSGLRLVTVLAGGRSVEGVIAGMDIVDYLGGGLKHNIILSHRIESIYDALSMPAEVVMHGNPIRASLSMTLPELLEVMIKYSVGALPVVSREGDYVGIVTEKSLIKYLTGKVTGTLVKDVMTENVICIDSNATLGKALKLMINTGVRRLPVTTDGSIVGMLSWKDIVDLVGRHKVFQLLQSKSIFELLSLPVSDVMRKGILTIEPECDIGEAASIMNVKNVGSLLVVSKGRLLGIITARDVLYGTVVARPTGG